MTWPLCPNMRKYASHGGQRGKGELPYRVRKSATTGKAGSMRNAAKRRHRSPSGHAQPLSRQPLFWWSYFAWNSDPLDGRSDRRRDRPAGSGCSPPSWTARLRISRSSIFLCLCKPHGPQNTLGCDNLRAHFICCVAVPMHGGIAASLSTIGISTAGAHMRRGLMLRWVRSSESG